MSPFLAATATADQPTPWGRLIGYSALALLAYYVLWYLPACAWRPFANCLCCKGNGKHHRKDGKVFRDCIWCRGSGRRLRIGRRVWNRFAKTRAAAK